MLLNFSYQYFLNYISLPYNKLGFLEVKRQSHQFTSSRARKNILYSFTSALIFIHQGNSPHPILFIVIIPTTTKIYEINNFKKS